MEDINKINIRDLMGRENKPDDSLAVRLMRENVRDSNMLSDIGKLRYTEGFSPGKNLFKSITEPFCDNIMLAKILDFEDCDGDYEAGKVRAKKAICGTYNKLIRSKFSNYNIKLTTWGVKGKSALVFKNANTDYISGKQKREILKRFTKPVILSYKVDLADICLQNLISQLDIILRELAKDYFYLQDFDITQDLTGIFDKREMEKYLCENHSFVLEGRRREKEQQHRTIVSNDKTVGMDCLTWVYNGVRAKIYNKFVCQVTSPGVIKGIGNHIINFIDCPDQRLNQTFANPEAKKHGITRFEATVYNNGDLKNYVSILKENLKYFEFAPFYSVPIERIWHKILNSVENNMLISYKNEICFGLWGNSLTRKITGYRMKFTKADRKDKLINFIINALSLQLVPINCISINRDYTFEVKCFVKNGCTYITKSGSIFYSPEHADCSVLAEHEKCKLSVFASTLNIKSKLDFCKFMEIPVRSKLFVKNFQLVKKEEEELVYLQEQKNFKSTSTFDREKWKSWFEKKERQDTFVKEIISIFCTRWIDPPQHSVINCYAFKIRKCQKYFFVGVLGTVISTGAKSIFYIKGRSKTKFQILFSDSKRLLQEGFRRMENGIWHYPYGEFLVLRTRGLTSYNGNFFTEVFFSSKIEWLDQESRNEIDAENRKMESCFLTELSVEDIKVTKCRRLEDLEEGFEFTISHLGEKQFRNKTRYVFLVSGFDSPFISNYWFEKLYVDLDKKVRLKCKLCRIKATPIKNEERLVLLSNI